ncbi:hypothetical protein O3G_MSEX008561 [Manduca sexta]|uniref:tRNA-splicing endonuclease subunit Sen15 domain-containing protein n=1 Tax=Manduca sexta TaxID=7130 RepID=A0A921ZAX5_MANSE|nr:hypothetical protein O3G_MSEX008561 [Manduca sexta]
MDVEEKIKGDMRSLGCNCEMKISLAYFLYIYLVDEKPMYDTEYCYNKDINTLYVVARPSKNQKLNIYVPVPTFQEITMDFISKLQENLCTVETGHAINLAFIDSDFTTVIYTFSKGISKRLPQEQINQNRRKEERRTFINNELKKSHKNITNDALNGGFVDDDDCQVVE